MTYICKDERSI